jgi:hypothetical protein
MSFHREQKKNMENELKKVELINGNYCGVNYYDSGFHYPDRVSSISLVVLLSIKSFLNSENKAFPSQTQLPKFNPIYLQSIIDQRLILSFYILFYVS